MNKFVPLLLATLLVGGILHLVHTCGTEPVNANMAGEAMATVYLPGGVELSVPEGSFNFALAQFLGHAGDKFAPRTFVFDHLNFASARTQITPE